MIGSAFLNGFLTGLWLSMSFGPVFFLLIQTGIKKGIKEAFTLDLGVFLSDLFYIVIAFFGASIILENETYKDWIGFIGGGVLIVFGIAPFFSRVKENPSDGLKTVARLNVTGLLTKGFFINLFNPSVLIIWFGAATWAFTTFNGETFPVVVYFAVTLITYFGIDVLKIYLALRLKKFINPKAMIIIHRISGLIVMVFGIWLIVNSLE